MSVTKTTAKKGFWEKVGNFFVKLGKGIWNFLKRFIKRAYWGNKGMWEIGFLSALGAFLIKTVAVITTSIAASTWGLLGGGLALVGTVIVMFEIREISSITKLGKSPKEMYGSWFDYIADTFGDITFGLVMAFFVLATI